MSERHDAGGPVWKAPARALRRRSSAVDRAAEYAEYAIRLIRDDPIIVYSMGKAGTTALEAAIVSSGRAVTKAHSLTRAGIGDRLAKFAGPDAERPRFVWRTQVLRWDLRLRPRKQRRMVCAVRDPVARAISAFYYGPEAPTDSETSPAVADGPQVIRYLRGMDIRADWFADELHQVTGIDVYAEAFPTDVGYRIYDNGRFRVLVTRQEDLGRVASTALGELLETSEPFVLAPANTASGGAAARRHREFRDSYRFAPDLLHQVYDQRLAQHFYSDDERTALIQRWSSPDADAGSVPETAAQPATATPANRNGCATSNRDAGDL